MYQNFESVFNLKQKNHPWIKYLLETPLIMDWSLLQDKILFRDCGKQPQHLAFHMPKTGEVKEMYEAYINS